MKPFLEVLKGHKCDKIPFWFMRQAGRYLPEYRELRAQKGGFMAMAMDPSSACEITMQPIRRFGMDAAILFSDILVIPYALGQNLEFAQGEGPKLPPIRSREDLSKLSYREFENKLAPVYQAIKLIRAQLTAENFNQTALIGFAGAPWTVATYMVEGGSSRDFSAVKTMAYADEALFSKLIEILTEATASYLIKQVQSGAEALQIFDSWAGALDSEQFVKWVIKPTKKIVDMVRSTYPDVPIIGFPKGAGQNYLRYVQDTGVNAVSLDPNISPDWAARTLQPLAAIQGNLDPLCLLAGGDPMILAAEKIMTSLANGPFIFNLGHGIDKHTPVEHVQQLVDFIKNFR